MLVFAENHKGQIVHISQTKYKDNAEYTCISCKSELHTYLGGNKKSKSGRSSHFQHKSGIEVKGCLMTQLHEAAQDLILNHRDLIQLPPQKVSSAQLSGSIDLPETKIRSIGGVKEKVIKAAGIEKFEKRVIDNLVETENGPVYFEVYVEHKVCEEKAKFLQSLNITCIEINLHKFERKNYTLDDLKNELFKVTKNKTYISHANRKQQLKKLYKEKHKTADRLEQALRKLKNKSVIKVPAYYKSLNFDLLNENYSERLKIAGECTIDIDRIEKAHKFNKHIIGKLITKRKHLWFVIAESSTINEPDFFKNSHVILIKMFGTNLQNLQFSWLNFPISKDWENQSISYLRDKKERYQIYEQFHLKCKQQKELYCGNKNLYFKHYPLWKKLLFDELNIDTLSPHSVTTKPKLNRIIKQTRLPNLWVFNVWEHYLFTALIIDIFKAPQNEFTSESIYSIITSRFPPTSAYLEWQKLLPNLDNDTKQIFDSNFMVSSQKHIGFEFGNTLTNWGYLDRVGKTIFKKSYNYNLLTFKNQMIAELFR